MGLYHFTKKTTMSKYRTATKNGCPTNWKYAVEKWTIVCKEINVSPLMSAAASFWGTGILVLFIFGGSLGFNSIVNVTPDLARHAFYIVPFIHLAGIFVVQSTIFQVAGTGNPGLTLAFGPVERSPAARPSPTCCPLRSLGSSSRPSSSLTP